LGDLAIHGWTSKYRRERDREKMDSQRSSTHFPLGTFSCRILMQEDPRMSKHDGRRHGPTRLRPAAESLERRDLLAVGITEFPVPGAHTEPRAIVEGADGNLWFTASDEGAGVIGRTTPSGAITGFPVPTADFEPGAMTLGPDGNVWFTETAQDILPASTLSRIGRVTPAGAITEFGIASPRGGAASIASGPDGALWFTEPNVNRIGRITTDGHAIDFPVSATQWGQANPTAITAGPDGALWFTGTGMIGRITTAGEVTEYVLPSAVPPAVAITTGPDKDLWFSFATAGYGKITTAGALQAFNSPGPSFNSRSIVTGPDNALWFADPPNHQIGRITADGTTLNRYLVPSVGAPVGIANGPGGTIWFVEAPNPGQDETQSYLGVAVLNATDVPLSLTPVPVTATSGQQFAARVATFTDADSQGVLADYKAAVNFTSDPTLVQPATIVPDAKGGFDVLASSTATTSGTFQMTVFDTKIVGTTGGATATATGTVTVVQPVVSAASRLTVHVSAAGVASAVATFDRQTGGPDFNTESVAIDWGDGQTSAGTLTNLGFQIVNNTPVTVYQAAGTHAYAAPGTYIVNAMLIETTTNQRASAQQIVVVKSVLPSLTANGTPVAGSLTVQSVAVATFQDPAGVFPLRYYAAMIDWGDGTPRSGGAIWQPLGTLTVLGTHQYTTPGTYLMTITIRAVDGRSVTTQTTAVVSGVVPPPGPTPANPSAPEVAGVAVLPASGQVLIAYLNDAAGLNLPALESAANYSLTVRGRSLPIASVALLPGTSGQTEVALTIAGGQRLPSGRALLRISSVGVVDLAGTPLDGEFTGRFPSGDGQPGGDFAATFTIGRRGSVSRLLRLPGPRHRPARHHR
jgi:virginiamycin B lyase